MGNSKTEYRMAAQVAASGRKLTGYAATFGQETRIGDFREMIEPGAFSLDSDHDVLALVDHDPKRLLARTRSGTLRLNQDEKGLAFEIDLPDTQHGRDILVLAERDDLGGMSFGFTVPKGGENWTGNLRHLTRINLHEISVVSSWPAYAGTLVQARTKLPPKLSRARRYMETMR